MDLKNSTDPKDTEIERLRLELKKSKLELEKLKQAPNSSIYKSNTKETAQQKDFKTIYYWSILFPPIGIAKAQNHPEMSISRKVVITLFAPIPFVIVLTLLSFLFF